MLRETFIEKYKNYFLGRIEMALKNFHSKWSNIFINLGNFSSASLIILILLSSVASLHSTEVSALIYTDENPAAFEINLNAVIQVGDWLAIFILPPVEDLWVKCNASRSSDFRISFSPRELQYGREISIIYVQLESEGVYNLLVSFQSSNLWNATIGVYTGDRDFYGKTKPASTTPQGYFIELYSARMMPNENKTSNYRLNIVLIAQKTSPSSFFNIKFPTPVNAALFALISAFIAYINAFFIIDSYFKNKSEGVSRIRWALIVLLILFSIYVLHQFYWMIVGGG